MTTPTPTSSRPAVQTQRLRRQSTDSTIESQSSTLVETPLDVDEVLRVLSSNVTQSRPARLPPDVESPRSTKTTATTATTASTATTIEQDSSTSPSLLDSFFSSLSSTIGWSTSPTEPPPKRRSLACNNRQQPSMILSPSQALPGAFPLSPAPLIEQSLGLETDDEEESPPRMYLDSYSIAALILPPIENAITTPSHGPPETSGDDSDSSYVHVHVPDPSSLQSPGHRFPPQAFRTIERSPLIWNHLPAVPTATQPASSGSNLPSSSSQARRAATSLSPLLNLPTTQTRSASPTPKGAQTMPAPPLSSVISLADAIPSLRRDQDSPPSTGSPASHSSGSSTVVPARQKTSSSQTLVRTMRLPNPASLPPTPPLVTAREPASSIPPSTPPVTHRRSPNVPDTPPILLANPTPPPATPPRQLRSPRAEAIWAAIVGPPPDLPLFNPPNPPAPMPVPVAPPKPPTPALPPVDPIYLLHFPRMDPIWNALPTGTFWEFARYALQKRLDFTRLRSENLIPSFVGRPGNPKKSNVQGIEEIRAWEEGNTDTKLSPEDLPWAQELDWEAGAIVEDKGRMLGIGVDGDMGDKFGTRYGGRVGFCALLKCEGNDGNGPLNLSVNARITLEKPMMRGSCLFTRVWGSHRFLRLKLSKPLLTRVNRDQSGRLIKELKEFCARPIHILGREYHPLVEKENTVYYFLYGRDRIGLKAIEDAGGDRQKPYGMGRHIGTVEGVVQWWLAPQHNRNQIMSKLTTRLHLGLSDTLPGVFVKPENVKYVPDIKRNGFMFTDGAGLESGSVARACWRKYHASDYSTPPATQIRISSAKGVVQIDPTDVETTNFHGPYTITLTESMTKVKYGPRESREFTRGPVHGMAIYDAAHYIVCIVKPAPTTYPARLSSQYITILSARGVPDDVFLELQREAVREELRVIGHIDGWWDNGSFSRAGVNGRMRLAGALETYGGLAMAVKKRDAAGAARGLGVWRGWGDDREDEDESSSSQGSQRQGMSRQSSQASIESSSTGESSTAPSAAIVDIWRRDEISGYPPLKYEALRLAVLQGVDIARSNHFRDLWTYTVQDVIRGVVLNMHLPVARSAGGFLQPDWTGSLEEGEIVFIPAQEVVDPETGLKPTAIVGEVVVGRHPALLPTDMRKVRAIDPPPQLRHCRGLLVFSTKGDRPLADILSGGDYDGDTGDVFWEPSIVSTFRNADLEFSQPMPGLDACFEKDTVTVDDLLDGLKDVPAGDRARLVSQQLLSTIGEPALFKWYSVMYNKATIHHGIDHITTRALAHKFCKLMDAKKSGIRIKRANLREDQRRWDQDQDPYWKYQQTVAKPGSSRDGGTPPSGRSMEPSAFILDVLVNVGSGFLKDEVDAFKSRLEDYHDSDFNARSQSGILDEDLKRPWSEARRWTRGEKDKTEELDLIKTTVEDCLDRFMKMTVKHIETKPSSRKQHEDLQAIVRYYASTPALEDLPLLSAGPDGATQVARIKASYTYVWDLMRYYYKSRKVGGSPSGFAWKVAMRELGDIKAKAVQDGNAAYIPYATVERMAVHRHFR